MVLPWGLIRNQLEISCFRVGHSPAETRHRGKANIAFCDGHAEPMSLDRLGYDVNDAGEVAPDGGRARNHLWTGRGTDPLRQAQ